MPVCVSDARPGGVLRYEWRDDATGRGFSATGEFLEVERPHRIVHVERMHLGPDGPDPTPDNRCVTTSEPDGAGGTRFSIAMTLPSAEALDALIASGMTDGMEASYARIDALEPEVA